MILPAQQTTTADESASDQVMFRTRGNVNARDHHWFAMVTVAALISLGFALSAEAQRADYEAPPIHYMTAEVNDLVAKLSRDVESGRAELKFGEDQGYLKSVLNLLDIPISSQTLVFSKTSLQQSRISPRRPRAIYFNDDVYVGYCQNGDVLELAATDPQQGATFYTLEQSQDVPPKFVRDQGECLSCHASNRTQNVPGYLVRSVFANSTGRPEFGRGTFTTDHTSPLAERWGGWYVTGTHGSMRHMGNAVFDKRNGQLDRETFANVSSLERLVSTESYLSSHSDIVALMVMEHQTQMHNAIAWANFETRRAIHQSEIMNEALGRPQGYLSESSERRIDRAADRVLNYLLLCDEFPLSSPVEGTSGFAAEFASRGIRDSQQRSLRDLDLTQRLFRYPCSYMIHSSAFAGLPGPVRSRVFTKLAHILDGQLDTKQTKRYAHLSDIDRQNVKQILIETQSEFAALNRRRKP